MLTVAHLSKPILDRSVLNHQTYKSIYEACVQHIKRKHATGCTITLFEVPAFVLGRPLYTHAHAIRYVAEKLRRGKFDVKEDGAMLHIDWGASLKKRMQHYTKKKKKNPVTSSTPQKKPKDAKEPLSVRLERLTKSIKIRGSTVV